MDCMTVERTVRMTPSVEFLDSSHTAILVGLGLGRGLGLRVVSSHTAILATHREGRGGAPRAGWYTEGRGGAEAVRGARDTCA